MEGDGAGDPAYLATKAFKMTCGIGEATEDKGDDDYADRESNGDNAEKSAAG
jgi:hypothetical protein